MANNRRTATQPAQSESTDAVKARIYSTAVKRLRDANRAEFDGYLEEGYAAAGLPYKPRLTPKQKARQAVEALIAEYPDLAAEIAAGKPEEPGDLDTDDANVVDQRA